MNAPWNVPISNRFSSLCARVFSPAAAIAAILESEKILGTRLINRLYWLLRFRAPYMEVALVLSACTQGRPGLYRFLQCKISSIASVCSSHSRQFSQSFVRCDRLLLEYALRKFYVVPWLFFEVRPVASVSVRIFISLKKFHVVSGCSVKVRLQLFLN